ncbi:hypothetical protein Scep_007605 [Stephania cephalantha]|uniref:Uncharacterized protein n=1 Tax=Stephania cephalantha TaxID=152367 RepID=A0AAP0KC08_9MAGN
MNLVAIGNTPIFAVSVSTTATVSSVTTKLVSKYDSDDDSISADHVNDVDIRDAYKEMNLSLFVGGKLQILRRAGGRRLLATTSDLERLH